jgi:hypothetical protein
VWVPACWIVERDCYGRCYRRYMGGHYECRNDRVWVAYDRYDNDCRDNDRRYNDCHDNRGRNDREVSSGYGRRR